MDVTEENYTNKTFFLLGYISEIVDHPSGIRKDCKLVVVNVNDSIQAHVEVNTIEMGESGVIDKIRSQLMNKLCLFINCMVTETYTDKKFYVEKRIKYSNGNQFVIDAEEYSEMFPDFHKVIKETLKLRDEQWTKSTYTDSRIITIEEIEGDFGSIYNRVISEHLTTENIRIRLKCFVQFDKIQSFEYGKEGNNKPSKRVDFFSHYCRHCFNRKLKLLESDPLVVKLVCEQTDESKGCGRIYELDPNDNRKSDTDRKFNFPLIVNNSIHVNVTSSQRYFPQMFLFDSVDDYIQRCYEINRLVFSECVDRRKDPLFSYIQRVILGKPYVGTFLINSYSRYIDNRSVLAHSVTLEKLQRNQYNQEERMYEYQSPTYGMTYRMMRSINDFPKELSDYFLPCPAWSEEEFEVYHLMFRRGDVHQEILGQLSDECIEMIPRDND
jgi:hypothetical protein